MIKLLSAALALILLSAPFARADDDDSEPAAPSAEASPGVQAHGAWVAHSSDTAPALSGSGPETGVIGGGGAPSGPGVGTITRTLGSPARVPVTSAGSAAAVGGGSDGAGDASFAHHRIIAVYEHQRDMPEKQASYGIFRLNADDEAVAVAFYTPSISHIMPENMCNVVKGATSATCGFESWVSEAPGGPALCTAVGGEQIVIRGFVFGSDVGAAKREEMFPANGPVRPGRDVCILRPKKKYYCNNGAKLAWKPADMKERPTCIGLRQSTEWDSPEMAELSAAAHPTSIP